MLSKLYLVLIGTTKQKKNKKKKTTQVKSVSTNCGTFRLLPAQAMAETTLGCEILMSARLKKGNFNYQPKEVLMKLLQTTATDIRLSASNVRVVK